MAPPRFDADRTIRHAHSPLPRLLTRTITRPIPNEYLAQPIGGKVYVDPGAFERFISSGSNIGLYAATIDALSELNSQRSLFADVSRR